MASLSTTEERALEYIREEGSVFQSELWKELDVSSRTGSRVARSLAEEGFVDRVETIHDGRKTYELSLDYDRENPQSPEDSLDVEVEGLSDEAVSVIRLLKKRGEVPLRRVDRQIAASSEEVGEVLRRLVDRELVTVKRERMYGREQDIVSLE